MLVVEAFSLPKVVELLEEVVVSWQEVRWIRCMRQNFIAQFTRFLKHWLCNVRPGIVMEKNWAHSVDQCQHQVFQFSMHLIDLLSILLRCNGFAGIRKAVVDQTTKQWPWPFFGASLALRNALEFLLGPTTELVVTSCYTESTFHCTSQSDLEMVHCSCVEEKMTLQNDDFFDFQL